MRISDWSSDVCSSDLVIFGYCVGNDVSVRDWQTRTQQVVIGKSFDTHAPFGPWIEAADGVDAGDLDLRLLVNGEERQHSRSEEHTSALQSLMRLSYAFFCLKKQLTIPDRDRIPS